MKPLVVICAHPKVQVVETAPDGGAFMVQTTVILPSMRMKTVWLKVIASIGGDWDHVSVSLQDRTPTWAELELVKRIFFKDDETAMQLHVPPKDHINRHDYVLHLWRPHNVEIPRPPEWMV